MSTQTSFVARPQATDVSDFHGALEYSAPFLVEKLAKDQIVDSASEGEMLFREVKRYLVLSRLDPDAAWQMYSMRVDEVWHQFVLYTHEYSVFCERHLGGFVHHRPSNAPRAASDRHSGAPTFAAFKARYREAFGQELPECWLDEGSITISRRLLNSKAGRLVVSEHSGRVSLLHEDGFVQLTVDRIAHDALAFIATTGAFYVRELPGDLTDEERIAIVGTLVEHRLLRIAP